MAVSPLARDVLIFIGRILFSIIFITAGLHKIIDYNNTVTMVASAGLPLPTLLTIGTIFFELVGGLTILLGWFTRLGALLIFFFLLVVTLVIHHFWSYSGQLLEFHLQNFFKNLAMMGGALYILSFGPGAFSLDNLRR